MSMPVEGLQQWTIIVPLLGPSHVELSSCTVACAIRSEKRHDSSLQKETSPTMILL